MIYERTEKSFFTKYWGWFVGGALFLALAGTAVVFYLNGMLWGSAKVMSLSLSQGSSVVGDHVTASVDVKNTGLLPMEYKGMLLIDGKESPLGEAMLSYNSPQTLQVDLVRLGAGAHTISIGGFEKQLTVLHPAELKVTSLNISPEKVYVGETVTVTATVANTGEVAAGLGTAFTFDGTALDTAAVSIGPGEEKPVTSTFTVQSKGDHTVALLDQKCTFTVNNEARLSLISLSTSKLYAKPGEAVTVVARLENLGDQAGQYDLDLSIDGKSFKKQTVTVQGKSTASFSFTVSEKKGGSHTIKAGTFAQILDIVNFTRPKTGTLLIKKASGGAGRLTITNKYKTDIVVVLASVSNPKAALISIYLRAGEKASNLKVKDGTYVTYMRMGSDYDALSGKFINNAVFVKFGGSMKFTTTRRQYSVWKMTLNVTGGNMSASAVGEGDMPQ